MIFYICHGLHAYTQASLMLYYRKDLQRFLRLVPYDDAARLCSISCGTVIWTDMDRLNDAEIETASEISRRIRVEQPGVLQLNDPRTSLQRFELLRKFSAEGINDFRAYRPDSLPDDIRFPAFVRDETGAAYREPMLLRDRSELDEALSRLPSMGFVRPMVVEFGSKPGPDGLFRKYAAYRVGERTYAQHCFAKKDWFIKDPGRGLPQAVRQEHLIYIRDNPHGPALMPLFDKAAITYGRIDYTLIDGRIQVFEINTNPTVLSYPPTPFDTYDPMPYANMHADALLALPCARDSASNDAVEALHSQILQRLRHHYRKRRRKLFFRKGLKFIRDAALGSKE
ncbi:hypothetical protein DPM33_27840 [Mesorhizobium hawassense]|uniref:ATP-grasp domain-containing protein n=1 Tax=Mesorhizobium hawassense TaxID=1209954 RepID=A0A330HJ90_9HYPH|nr:hypothetical protein [Mesorhizobium hawassense]RAZ86629.1 hypothetical protein DPM33_27840 [Mesorhizobium hawassense]